jgi:hypothetical protein
MCTRSCPAAAAALGLGWVSATVPALMPSVLFTRAAGGRSSSLSMCARQPMVSVSHVNARPAGTQLLYTSPSQAASSLHAQDA